MLLVNTTFINQQFWVNFMLLHPLPIFHRGQRRRVQGQCAHCRIAKSHQYLKTGCLKAVSQQKSGKLTGSVRGDASELSVVCQGSSWLFAFPRVCYLLALTTVSPQVLQMQNYHLSQKVCTGKACCDLPNKNLQNPTGWSTDALNTTDELCPPSKAVNLPELMELQAHVCVCFLPSRKKTSSARSPFRPTLSNIKPTRAVPRGQEASLCNGRDICRSLCRRWSRHEIMRSVNPLPVERLTSSACAQQKWRWLFSSGNKIWMQEERKYPVLP